MPICYVIYSESIDRFYIGSTMQSFVHRLHDHHHSKYGDKSFTAKAHDWTKFLVIECSTIKQAGEIERHIKKMKSRLYLENLKKYPEMVEKLLERY